MRRIEIHLRRGDACDAVLAAVRRFDPVDHSVIEPQQEDRLVINVLVRDSSSQKLVDVVQSALEEEHDWRLNVIAIEASLPRAKSEEEVAEARNTQAIREEIVSDINKGAVLDRDFVILVVLSTVVAAVGMNSGSVAGVIGAMVIAPLLGPILAFSLGAALGQSDLLLRSARTLAVGVGVAFISAFALAYIIPVDLTQTELTSRAEVRLDALALALAAGGAAALSVAKGQNSGLVGVMVAAALLPPGAAIGLFAGVGEFEYAARAGLLLLLNVACLVLAALLTFRFRKIRPRNWFEQKNATVAVRINIAAWAVLLAISAALIVYFDLGERISLGG
ncbi:MAG: TIGR00341 family protein [Pseudomonadota bacterium]